MLKDLVLQTRSVRRFYEETPVPAASLREWVDLARQCASTRNAQPLKYVMCTSRQLNAGIFPLLAWAGYLKDWGGPVQGERPAAYLVVLGDARISRSCDTDAGIAGQTILLAAKEAGWGGCIIGSVKREALASLLALPEHLQILFVIVLGKPKEQVVLEPLPPDGDVRYWRDDRQIHHVPKRGLEEVIVATHE
jgi:nitroreductase